MVVAFTAINPGQTNRASAEASAAVGEGALFGDNLLVEGELSPFGLLAALFGNEIAEEPDLFASSDETPTLENSSDTLLEAIPPLITPTNTPAALNIVLPEAPKISVMEGKRNHLEAEVLLVLQGMQEDTTSLQDIPAESASEPDTAIHAIDIPQSAELQRVTAPTYPITKQEPLTAKPQHQQTVAAETFHHPLPTLDAQDRGQQTLTAEEMAWYQAKLEPGSHLLEPKEKQHISGVIASDTLPVSPMENTAIEQSSGQALQDSGTPAAQPTIDWTSTTSDSYEKQDGLFNVELHHPSHTHAVAHKTHSMDNIALQDTPVIRHDHITQDVVNITLQASKDSSNVMTVELSPASLGTIEMRFEFAADGNKTHVVIAAAESSTLNLFMDSKEDMRQLFHRQGMDAEFTFQHQHSGQQHYPQENTTIPHAALLAAQSFDHPIYQASPLYLLNLVA